MGIIWEDSFVIFFIQTIVIGGGAAFLAGRALAMTWRPVWFPLAYMLILGAAVRFFHYALFGGTLLSVHYYLVATAILMAFALLGYRLTRTSQMVTQYRWLYERSSPLSWRKRADAP